MSEAIILGVIGELESFLIELPTTDDFIHYKPETLEALKEVIKELRMMSDFFRDNKSEEMSRLKNLQADFAEIAQVSAEHKSRLSPNDIYKDLSALRKIKERMMEFGAGKVVSSSECVGEEGNEGVVVGLEKDIQQLVFKVILSEEEWLIHMPILIKGMVGMGKTTLARQAYNHPAIIEEFKRCRAWVSLSSFTSKHEVLVELIRQLVTLDGDSLLLEEMDNQSLEQMLLRHLEEMPPWFIVLDNVLPEMRFKSFLLDLARRSKPRHKCGLLITSCHQIFEKLWIYTHEMKAMDSDKSWQLFLQTINKFTSDDNKFSNDLEKKVKEMLKKCGGLQRLLGIEWEELFDSIDLSKTLKLLEPMYNSLKEHLKSYFLHMSFFKENAIMREEKLKHIWATSGLRNGNKSCASLADQSMIEVVHPYPEFRRVKRCRMNPVLHMLCIKKAEEEIGLEILRNNGNNRPLEIPHHRVIHCGRAKFNHSTNQDKYLVSLIFHGGGRYLEDVRQSYWKSLELLKILDMEDFGVKNLSKSIGTLTGLRYLGLRNNYVQEIPHSLGGLKRLEVLDIALNFMVEVPDIIKKMGGLRHLYMSDVICRKPLKVDALQNLETLTFMSIYSWTYEASNLGKMSSLCKLGIEDIDENSDVSELFPALDKLKELDHLILRGFRFRMISCLDEIRVLHGRYNISTLRVDGCIARLPSADSFPYGIEYLALVNTCLDEDPMPILMELPYLRRLKLRNAYNGQELVFKMRELHILCISELWNLRKVRFEESEIASLWKLEITNCPHLETLPQEIQSMSYLRKLTMVTTKHIATKIKDSDLLSKIVEVDISP
ncbi:disease resistance protein RPH8A-like [Salvia hispanica]|uniref:disease resistance protein RPH8A-like n=1 Tax=Salvia hispanica TaxID=49212 RepID=UPI0020094E0C|nr:disease resistance protein RPH8A-like [Salvia hispanica]